MCETSVRRGALWTLVNRSSQAWQKQYCTLARDGVLSFYDERPKSCDDGARAQLDVRQFIVDPVDDASGKVFGRKHVLVLCPLLPRPVISKAASTSSLGNDHPSLLHHRESFARTRSASLARQLSDFNDAHHHQAQVHAGGIQQQHQLANGGGGTYRAKRASTMSRLNLNSHNQLTQARQAKANGVHRLSDSRLSTSMTHINKVSPPTSPTLRRPPVAGLPLPLSPRGKPAIPRSSVPLPFGNKPPAPPLPPPRSNSTTAMGTAPLTSTHNLNGVMRPPITPRENISFTAPRGLQSQSQPVSMSTSNGVDVDAPPKPNSAEFVSSSASPPRSFSSRLSTSKSRSVSPPPKMPFDESVIPPDAVVIACKTDLDKAKWVKVLHESLSDAGQDLNDSDSDGEVGKRNDSHSLYGSLSQSPMSVSSLMLGGDVGVPDGHDVEYGDTLSKYRQYRTTRRDRPHDSQVLENSLSSQTARSPSRNHHQQPQHYNTLPARSRSMYNSRQNSFLDTPAGATTAVSYTHTPSMSGEMSMSATFIASGGSGSSGGDVIMTNGAHSTSSSSGDLNTLRAHRGSPTSTIGPSALFVTRQQTSSSRNTSAPPSPRGASMNYGLGDVTERHVHVPSADSSLTTTPRVASANTQSFFGRRNPAGVSSAPSSGDETEPKSNGFASLARRSDPAIRSSIETVIQSRNHSRSLQHTPGHDSPAHHAHHKPRQESVANFFGAPLAGTPQAQFMDGERDVKKLKKELGIHQEGASLRPIKKAVSKSKRRFIADGFDLDLTYITDRIIAMGFPSQNLESVYRNSMSEIQQFFKSRHDGHYMIYNLCSERNYDISKFDGNVDHFPFDDHNCPAFDDLLPFCKKVDEWMGKDKKNVATFHCKAGKGRTGLMICVYLLHSGMWKDPEQALQFYGIARTFNGKGVTIPSQKRWVQYFAKLKEEQRLGIERAPARKLILTKIRLANAAPQFSSFVVTCKSMDVKYSSKRIRIRQQLKSDESSVINCGSAMVVSHDVRLEFVKTSAFGVKSRVFSLWIHTGFVTGNQLKLTKTELDKANKDKKMGDFWIELIFEDFEDAETEEVRASQLCTKARLTEEMMDESESDPDEARELEAAVDGLSAEMSDRELYGLCLRMRREIPEKNRSHKLRLFRRCIVGSEVVTWLLKNLTLVHVQDAISVGQRMLDLGLFNYVNMEPVDIPDFQQELAARIGAAHSHSRPSSSPSTLERPRRARSPSSAAASTSLAAAKHGAPMPHSPMPMPHSPKVRGAASYNGLSTSTSTSSHELSSTKFENSNQFYRFPRAQQPTRPPRALLKKSLTGDI